MNRRKMLLCGLVFVLMIAGCGPKDKEVGSFPLATPKAENVSTVEVINTTQVEEKKEETQEVFAQLGDNLPVSRGIVAKMLALAFHDKAAIDQLDREINFTDTRRDIWYDRYINACVVAGLMQGSEGLFLPEQPLTLAQAQSLLDRLDPNNKIKMKLEGNGDKPISYALWTDLYHQMLLNMSGSQNIGDSFGISKDSVVVLATPGNNEQLKEWNMITDKGPMLFSGLAMDHYIDKEISILKKDGEVLAVLQMVTERPTLQNAYIVKSANMGITVFIGGVERTYTYPTAPAHIPTGRICDIQIHQGQALMVRPYTDVIRGTIKRTTGDLVELKEYGSIPLAKEATYYAVTDGGIKWKSLNALTVGSDVAEFVVADGAIHAGIMTKTSLPKTMRVVISTTGFQGYVHEAVELTCTTNYAVDSGKEKKNFKAGEVFKLSATENQEMMALGRIYIQPENEMGQIQLLSIKRNWGDNESPKYRGKMEVGKEEKGFSIVNEVSMEEYLYAVVPSEMPTSHGIDASKVQAITARSYAFNQYYQNRYHRYGANVDDSVSCQVYNNIPENITSIEAVNQTAGQCLVYEGEVISANFFSTSCGMTANSGEVWPNSVSKQFPASSAPYLTSVKQYTGTDFGDLSVEKNVAAFLKDNSIKGYDSRFPWFRWQVDMTREEMTRSINAGLKTRYAATPKMIKTLQPDGVFRSREIGTIGELIDIEIIKRSKAGNLIEIKLIGTEATVLVSSEYNIRFLLKPQQLKDGERKITITRKDGSTVDNYILLPSAFFIMEKQLDGNGKLQSIKFIGGGNGHGVGMSQNGVKGMIEDGFDSAEILAHYYQGTTVEKKY